MTPQEFIAKWGPGGPAFHLNEERVRIPVNVTADSGIVTDDSGERDRARCCAL